MRNLKRALSLLLSSTMVLGMMVMGGSAAGYQDVDDTYHKEAIEVLQAVGIMTGDENGNFNPEKGVTRNEMAVIMSNLMAYNVATYSGTSPFTDVPSWAEPYVAACYTNGITSGISATEYGGDQTVTTAQAALMIMKALGYFQYSSDFGSDWQLATVSQGNKIDLFEKVNSGVKEAMSRNDVAQLVLNGLESGTVEATTNGSITVGDTTIVSGVKYNYVTSTQDYAKSIDTVRSTSETTDANAFIVELGEKLYMGSLRKDETVSTGGALNFYEDVFGRPATRWEYQSKEVGVYANEADHAYSNKVTAKTLYDAVGRTAAENYVWTITIDGDEVYQAEGFKALVDNKTDTVKEVMDLTLGLANGTGNGVRTEIFVDAVNGYVHMSLTHYYAAEVYTVDEDNNVTTLADLGNGPAALDDEFDTAAFEEDQVVVYSFTKGEIQEVYAATSMDGTVTATRVNTDEKDGDYYIVDGEKYNYNWSVPSEDRLETENVNNDMVGYLDQYGYAIYIDEAAVSYDYAYVLSMGNDGDIYGGNADTYYARLVLTDGTVVKAETDEDDKSLENHIVSYTVDKNGVYTLSDRSNKTALADIDNIDVDNGIAAFQINGKNYTANSSTVFIIGDSAKDKQDFNNYDFTAYTGVKNMPNITNGTDDKFVIATADNSNVAKVVYVQDADVSGAGDVYFVRANVGAKLVNDSELGRYREIDAVVDGEVTTLKVKEGTTAEEILCGGVSNQVTTLTQLTPAQGLYLNDAGTQRILALESITTNADGLVTNVRLYDARNAQGDGFVNFYAEGTDKATKETVMLGGTEDTTPGTRYAWYDDVAVVRWDTYAGEFKVSTINSVKTDINDRAVAVLADDVLNGLCIVEYKTGATLPAIPQQDVTVDMEDNNFNATFNGKDEGSTIENAKEGDIFNIVITEKTLKTRAAGEKVTTLVAGTQYVVVINGVEKNVTCSENGKLSFDYALTKEDIAAGKVVIDGVFTYVEEPVEPGEGEVTLTVNAPNAAVTINGEAVTSAAVKENTDATITVTANTGYELVAVKVGDETITANADGSYTIKMADADVTVTVETKKVDEPVVEESDQYYATVATTNVTMYKYKGEAVTADEIKNAMVKYYGWDISKIEVNDTRTKVTYGTTELTVTNPDTPTALYKVTIGNVVDYVVATTGTVSGLDKSITALLPADKVAGGSSDVVAVTNGTTAALSTVSGSSTYDFTFVPALEVDKAGISSLTLYYATGDSNNPWADFDTNTHVQSGTAFRVVKASAAAGETIKVTVNGKDVYTGTAKTAGSFGVNTDAVTTVDSTSKKITIAAKDGLYAVTLDGQPVNNANGDNLYAENDIVNLGTVAEDDSFIIGKTADSALSLEADGKSYKITSGDPAKAENGVIAINHAYEVNKGTSTYGVYDDAKKTTDLDTKYVAVGEKVYVIADAAGVLLKADPDLEDTYTLGTPTYTSDKKAVYEVVISATGKSIEADEFIVAKSLAEDSVTATATEKTVTITLDGVGISDTGFSVKWSDLTPAKLSKSTVTHEVSSINNTVTVSFALSEALVSGDKGTVTITIDGLSVDVDVSVS